MFTKITAPAILALASVASATLNINNWCNVPVYIRQANPGVGGAGHWNCDAGPDGVCGHYAQINPGQILNLPWIANGQGTSVKVSKNDPGFNSGIIQLEYTKNDALWWDLSNLDGRGPGLVGTPFGNDNVKVTPTGNGHAAGTCTLIRCYAGTLCRDAYQTPTDSATRWCPGDTGDMWLDLCEPTQYFNNSYKKSRAVSFQA
ncbi:hypothetical protein GQ53DRAFT_772320 [Thozetella sp. PMI_491]|nr:hypothetical protein GQ53DRAFT_772320 [Thozetella sp. PMI_491]